MILLLCAVKRGRSPFDTIKNKTKTEKPKPEQKCSPHQAGPGPGHWFCLPSVCLSVCMWRMLPLLPTPATTTLNMTQNNALNRTKTNSSKKRRRKQNTSNSSSNNKILYSYFIPKMCPDQGRQRCPDQCNCLPLLVKLRTS